MFGGRRLKKNPGGAQLWPCTSTQNSPTSTQNSPTSTQNLPTSTAKSYAPSPKFSLKSYQKYAKLSVAMWDVAMFSCENNKYTTNKGGGLRPPPTQGRRRLRRRRPCVGSFVGGVFIVVTWNIATSHIVTDNFAYFWYDFRENLGLGA